MFLCLEMVRDSNYACIFELMVRREELDNNLHDVFES